MPSLPSLVAGSMSRVAVAGLTAVSIPVLISCTTGHRNQAKTPSVPPQSTATAAPTPTSTRLSCRQQLPSTVPAPKLEPHVLGLSSDGWRGSPLAQFRHSARVADSSYYGFKTYTYVTRNSAPRTTVHVLMPANARLYYTDGTTWNSGPTARQIIEGARKSVSLQSCGSDLTGYPGMLLLSRPACVTVEIIAHRATEDQRRRVKIPMGKLC